MFLFITRLTADIADIETYKIFINIYQVDYINSSSVEYFLHCPVLSRLSIYNLSTIKANRRVFVMLPVVLISLPKNHLSSCTREKILAQLVQNLLLGIIRFYKNWAMAQQLFKCRAHMTHSLFLFINRQSTDMEI